MRDYLKGKKILVTGGAGYVGQALVFSLLTCDPAEVRILDSDESKEFELRQKLKEHPNAIIFLGDIRDKVSLEQVMKGIDIVFHLAALKHVTACEYDPYEAVKTNIQGTQNVIDVAKREGVGVLVYTSSDKAVDPTSFMGITKLVGERLVSSSDHKMMIDHETMLSSVRFGNVLDSSGSLLPLLKSQIANGGPVTITDDRMTRFVMGRKAAVELILDSADMAKGGEVFIKKMPSVKITDLVDVLVEELSPRHGHEPEEIEREIIGAYPGEKLFEEIMTEDENRRALETEEMFIILSPLNPNQQANISNYVEARIPTGVVYRSKDAPLLSKNEIKKMLTDEGLL